MKLTVKNLEKLPIGKYTLTKTLFNGTTVKETLHVWLLKDERRYKIGNGFSSFNIGIEDMEESEGNYKGRRITASVFIAGNVFVMDNERLRDLSKYMINRFKEDTPALFIHGNAPLPQTN